MGGRERANVWAGVRACGRGCGLASGGLASVWERGWAGGNTAAGGRTRVGFSRNSVQSLWSLVTSCDFLWFIVSLLWLSCEFLVGV